MGISYTKQQRQYAKENGLHLITLAVPGMEFQGPASEEEVSLITKCMQAVFKLRGKHAKDKVTFDEANQ